MIEARIPPTSVDDDDEDYSDKDFDDDEDSERCESQSPRRGKRVQNIDDRLHKSTGSKEDINSAATSDNRKLDNNSDGSDVTDVSPLGSPVAPSFTRNNTYKKSAASKPRRKSDDVDYDAIDIDSLLETVLNLETPGSRCRSRSSQGRPGSSMSRSGSVGAISRSKPVVPGPRRNYTFNNDRIREIDRENQRLMGRIMKHASDGQRAKNMRNKTGGGFGGGNKQTSSTVIGSRPRQRPVSSASINRAKQLAQINAENLV